MREDLYNQPAGEVFTDKTGIKLLTTIIVGVCGCVSVKHLQYQEKYKHRYTAKRQEGSPAASLQGALLPPHSHQAMRKGRKDSYKHPLRQKRKELSKPVSLLSQQ